MARRDWYRVLILQIGFGLFFVIVKVSAIQGESSAGIPSGHLCCETKEHLMSRLVAYMGSDPERLKAALLGYRDLFVVRLPTRPSGGETLSSTGVGFYQGGEVLLQRRPRVSGGAIDLFEDLKDLRTDTFLAQVRDTIQGKLAKNENTPPFRFRSCSQSRSCMRSIIQSTISP